MKNRLVWLAVGGMVALLAWYAAKWSSAPTPQAIARDEAASRAGTPGSASQVPTTPPTPAVANTSSRAPLSNVAVGTPNLLPALTAPPALAGAPAASPTPPILKVEVDKVRLMIRGYHDVMGENPVGTNAEIMQAVMGRNPKQAALGPPEGQTLNAQGELIDQWGTPFFFHQLSRDVMEIRSAGPDKMMGTPDDVVVR